MGDVTEQPIGKARIRSHTLKPLSSSHITKREFIGFDVETYGQHNTFLMGGFYWYYGKYRKPTYISFWNKNKMIEYVLKNIRFFRKHWIVATNLEFDFTTLFKDTKYWNCFNLLFRDSQLISVSEIKEPSKESKSKQKRHGLQFIDTMNYAPYSVAKWGKILGKRKLEPPSSWEKTTLHGIETLLPRKPKNEWERKELEEYNMRDCEISCDAMYLIQQGINNFKGQLKITIASSCFDIFRRSFQNIPMIKEQYVLQDDKVLDLIYQSYYGGRTEVFKRGEFKDLYYYDINSLYPSVMKNEIPIPQSVNHPTTPERQNIVLYEGVSKVDVIAPTTMDKPFLPYRDGQKLIFPTGKFTGAYTHVELRKALELGYTIGKIHDQLYYTETQPMFKQYVDVMYKTRLKQKQAKDPLQSMTKLLMNSLYGGFGMKSVTETKLLDMNYLCADDLKQMDIFEIIGNHVIQRTTKTYNGRRKFPIIATYVTAYARCTMYDYVNNSAVIYTDTDSIFTTVPLDQSLISNQLGAMKLEGTYSHGIFIKPKMYAITNDDDQTTVRLKGVSKPTYDEFLGTVTGGAITKLKFCRLKESVRRGLDTNSIIPIEKNMDLTDTKRTWESELILGVQVNSKPREVNE